MSIKPIALSFKHTKEDIELYAWIISHSNMSGFIKDTLRSAMNSKGKIEIKTESSINNESLIDLNQ